MGYVIRYQDLDLQDPYNINSDYIKLAIYSLYKLPMVEVVLNYYINNDTRSITITLFKLGDDFYLDSNCACTGALADLIEVIHKEGQYEEHSYEFVYKEIRYSDIQSNIMWFSDARLNAIKTMISLNKNFHRKIIQLIETPYNSLTRIGKVALSTNHRM